MVRRCGRRAFIKAVGVGVSALAVAPGRLAAQSASGTRPNVVLILADDLGFGDLGCYGATKLRTPNIDRLAQEGRKFTDAHSVSAVCTPSRYGLLTGEYPFRVNVWGPHPPRDPLIIDPKKLTLARLLKEHDYSTACIGKWHLGFGNQRPVDWNSVLRPGPLELGFDYYFGIPQVSSGPPFVYVENDRVVGLDPQDPIVYGGTSPTQVFPEKGIKGISGGKAAHALYRDEELGTTLCGKAVDWLRAHQAERFFLYLATPGIHHPFTPHPRFKGTSQCGLYGDFVQELDWIVGEVLRTLDELKLADDTIVIFTSDNGGMLNDGGKAAWKAGHRLNGDLLGFKFDAWEGGHRVPFIARWPGRIPPGSKSNQLIAHVDMPATFAGIVGCELKEGDAPDSLNVLSALTGDPAAPIREEVILAPWKPSALSIRKGDWVYIGAQGSGGFAGDRGGPGALAFAKEVNSDVTPAGKLRTDAPPAQLYNLRSDPAQARNVYREHPETVKELSALLSRRRVETRTRPAG